MHANQTLSSVAPSSQSATTRQQTFFVQLSKPALVLCKLGAARDVVKLAVHERNLPRALCSRNLKAIANDTEKGENEKQL